MTSKKNIVIAVSAAICIAVLTAYILITINRPKLLWKYKTDYIITSSPAVEKDTVYFGGWDQRFYALDRLTGEEEWTLDVSGPVVSSPVIKDGVVYFGCTFGTFYAVDAKSGEILRKYETGAERLSTPIASGDALLFQSSAGDIFVIDDAGVNRLDLRRAEWLPDTLSISGGVLYVGGFDNNLYAFSPSTGEFLWKLTLEKYVSTPAVVKDGIIYFGSHSSIFAVDVETLTTKWKFTDFFSNSTGPSTVPVISGDAVIFGGDDNYCYALDIETGRLKWKYYAGMTFRSMPINTAPAVYEGVVYFGSYYHHLYAVKLKSGRLKWKFETESAVNSSPLVADGVIYFGSGDGYLYALRLP